jgi:uncharacterized protein YuzE
MKSPLHKIEYDKTVDALYIYTSNGKISKTIKLNNRVLFDVDKKGKIVGIEILDASKPWKIPKGAKVGKIKELAY